MELSVQQISYLLEVAEQSSLTAEEISELIRIKELLPPRERTVREVFTKENIKKYGCTKYITALVYRLIDTQYKESDCFGENRPNRLDNPVSLVLEDIKSVGGLPALFRGCGRKATYTILMVLKGEGLSLE